MKTNKRFLATVLTVALLLSIAMMATGCANIKAKDVEKDPTGQILTSIAKTKDVLKASGESSPLTYMANTLEKGAFTVRYAQNEGPIISNTMYIDSKDVKFADFIAVGNGEEQTEVGVYLNKNDIVLSLPEEYGGKNIGVSLGTLASELKDAKDILSLTGMTYDEFMSQFGAVLNALNGTEEKKPLSELLKLKEMADKLEDALDDCDIDVTEDKIITGSDKVKAVIVTYNLSTEDLTKIATILADWVGESYSILMSELSGSLGEMGFFPDSIKDVITEAKAEFETGFKETNLRAAITVAINPKTEVIMRADCKITGTVDEKEEHVTISLDLGENPQASPEYQLTLMTSSGIESAASKVTIGYQRKDITGLYHRRIYCTILGDEFDQNIELVFKWNTKSNIYTLAYDSVDASIEVSGDCKAGGKKLEFSIDKIDVDDEVTEVGLEFMFEQGKKTPEAPNYTSIFDLPESELENLLEMAGLIGDEWIEYPTSQIPTTN